MILRGVRGGASLPPKVKGRVSAGFPLTFRRLSGTLRGFTPNQTLRRKSQACYYGDRSSWTPSSSRPPAPGARRALDIPRNRAPVFLMLTVSKTDAQHQQGRLSSARLSLAARSVAPAAAVPGPPTVPRSGRGHQSRNSAGIMPSNHVNLGTCPNY